MTLVWPWFQ